MSAPGSVTDLLARVAKGDAAAARRLWDVYFPRLVALARRRLAGSPPGPADAEDVALDALASFFLGAQKGRYSALSDREELWGLLTVIAARKAFDLLAKQARRQRQGPHAPLGDDLAAVPDPHPAPDLEAQLAEECQRLLERLGDPQLRAIVIWKLEDLTDADVATRLGCSLRTVERKLRLIRQLLADEVQP